MERSIFASLEEQKNIFYRCVEDSNEAIMITDDKGLLIYVNKAWQAIYGFTAQEALGNTPRMLRSKYQDPEFYKQMWAIILDPKKGYWKGYLTNHAKSGKEVPVLLTITPYRDASGQIKGYMGIALDMTEKKEMEAQIIRQDRLVSVGMLASGLAHEIGTPLGVIRGRAEYLSYLAGDNEKLKSGLEVIVTQIDRISKLIYSLLNLARIEKSETSHPISVIETIRQVVILTEQKLRDKNITCEIDVPENLRVVAEQDRLLQVELNLVINAIHAIEERSIKEPQCKKILRISCLDLGDKCEIHFTDSGVGISRDNLKNLFKPFFTTKDIGVGTGLGLPISLQLVQSWNGDITVESREGEGSTFKVILHKKQSLT